MGAFHGMELAVYIDSTHLFRTQRSQLFNELEIHKI